MESLQISRTHGYYTNWRFVPAAVVAIGLVFDQVAGFGPLSYTDLLIIVAAGITLLLTEKIEIDQASIVLLLCLFLLTAFSFASYIKNGQIDQLKFSVTLLLIFLLSLIVIISVKDDESHHRILIVLAVIAASLSILNILQGLGLITLPSEFRRFVRTRDLPLLSQFIERRATSIYKTFGISGIWTTIGASTSYYTYSLWNTKGKILSVITFILHLFNGFYVLQSRNIWVGLTVVSTLVVIHSAGRISKRATLTGLASVGIAGTILTYIQNLPSLIISVNPNTVSKRLEQYIVGLELVAQNPLFGVGRGEINRIVGQYLHSVVLQPLVYNGVPSGLVFFFLIIYVFVNLLRYSFSGSKVAIIYLQIVSGVFIVSLTYPAFSTYSFWLVISLSLSFTGNTGIEDSG